MYFMPNLHSELGSFWNDSCGLQKLEHSSSTKDKRCEKSCLVAGFGIIPSVIFSWIALCIKGCGLSMVWNLGCSGLSFAWDRQWHEGTFQSRILPVPGLLPLPLVLAFPICCSKEFIATRCHWHEEFSEHPRREIWHWSGCEAFTASRYHTW